METIHTLDIKTSVTKSVLDVFATMLSFELEIVQESDITDSKEMRIVGSVNFAGQVSGVIQIHIHHEFASLMTSVMLGMTPEEIEGEDEIRDVICEISNIIGGSLKSFFNDSGFYCVLTTPSITSGDDFSIQSLNTERYESFNFKYQGHVIRIEIGVKVQGDYKADAGGKGSDAPLIDIEKIRNMDISAKVPDSVINVFNMMLSMDIQIARTITQTSLEGDHAVGAVSFAGDAMGLINIHLSPLFSKEMAAKMLDMNIEEVDVENDVNDVIGELSNIIGGNLKSVFSDVGLRCELSTPSITRGSDFKIESMNMERYERFAFTYNEHVFFVEFGLKIAEGLNIHLDSIKEVNYQVEDQPLSAPQWPDFDANAGSSGDSAPSPEEIESSAAHPPQTQEYPDAGRQPTFRQDIPSGPELSDGNLAFLLDIPLEISIELGRTKMKINDLLKIKEKSILELSTLAEDPVDILVNHKLIARGEVVVEGGKYGIRVTEVLSRADRIKSLN